MTDTWDALHGELLRSTGHLVRRAMQWYSAIWSSTVPDGLTSPQFTVLRVLASSSSLHQRTIGERAGLDKSTCGQVIDRLHELGYVRACVDPANRRRKLVDISACGRAVFDATAPLRHQVERTAVAALSDDERSELNRLLAKMMRLDSTNTVLGADRPAPDTMP
jgi:DNA-binding MarR family transcriptional regulator